MPHVDPAKIPESRYGAGLYLSVGGFAVFFLLALLVQMRLLQWLDITAALALLPLASNFLDSVSTVLSIGFSGEITLLFAAGAALLLWRQGYGIWSLGPFAFLLPNILEVLMKMLVNQPGVPPELHRTIYYPLANVNLAGSFPSGHAMRSGFFCVLTGMLVGSRGGPWGRIVILGLIVLAGLAAFTRVYIGDHWLTDVVGGMLLGGSTAILAVRTGWHAASASGTMAKSSR